MSTREHWEQVYSTKPPDQVSWYSPHLDTSLELIERVAPSNKAAILDVGGGASTLVDDLLASGYQNLTVLDISQTAIDTARKRLGADADRVHWRIGDITHNALDSAQFDLWHDRAVFHFLTDPANRAAYIRQVLHSVKPGGHGIISTFGPEGPTRCSGLDIVRYDASSLQRELGQRFQLLDSFTQQHSTPFGSTQQFLYCLFRLD
ncbi:MAG TPA: class I SAM-dependent methyltransferase [Acidobacteriaceae bacterium]|nr:class I SAM-dependent methyltransferase [Acidobacteriaceae bacterium]